LKIFDSLPLSGMVASSVLQRDSFRQPIEIREERALGLLA
jgi:hypothetical protein